MSALTGAGALVSLPLCAQSVSGSFQGIGFLGGLAPSSSVAALSADGTTIVGYSSDAMNHYVSFRWNGGTMTALGLSTVAAVSADGTVVAGNFSQPQEAAFWSGGIITPLGFIGGGGSRPFSSATAVSADGTTVVGSSTDALDYVEAFRWNRGIMTGLGFAGGGALAHYSMATAVSADGTTVVGVSTSDLGLGSNIVAFRWNNGTMTGLGYIGGGGSSPGSFATAVSADGATVAGYSTDASNYQEAFRWTGGTMTGLGFVGGGGSSPGSYAVAISADGTTVVGYSTDAANNTQAFRWNGGTMTGLGHLSGSNYSTALAVSANGAVVVGLSGQYAYGSYFGFDVFRWTAATQLQRLSTLLTAAGVNMSGFTSLGFTRNSYPFISANGEFIAGTGLQANGQQEAWIVRYIDAAVASTPPIAGISTGPSLVGSIAPLGAIRGGAMIQQQGLAAPLFHDDGPIAGDSEGGAFGTIGSLSGGISGRVALVPGLSFAGGLAYVSEDYNGFRITDSLVIGGALRYVYDLTDAIHLFGQAGGWVSPLGTYQFSRSYANGAGIAIGLGSAFGAQSYGFIRAGAAYKVGVSDEWALSGELGAQTLHTGGYLEPLSNANPFNAFVSGGTDSTDVAKLRLQWTHAFSPKADATLWGAAAEGFNRSANVFATVAGVGPVSSAATRTTSWAEFGARFSYKTNAWTSVQAFVDGVTGGGETGTKAHFGGGLTVRF
jgi:probable HAF family extracellular repeat protein